MYAQAGLLQCCSQTLKTLGLMLTGLVCFRLLPQATLLIHRRLTQDSFLDDLYLECGYEDLRSAP